MENVSTTGLENQTTPKEKEAPTVSTVPVADTLTRTLTKSVTEESSEPNKEVQSNVKETQPEPSSDNPEPSFLVALGRPPEICNLLEIGDAYNHFNMKEYTDEIDAFINEQVKAKGLPDNK